MPQSVHSGGSGSSNHHRYVHVVLLSRETVVIPVENKHTKVQDIFSKACELVNLRETDFFGLAQLKENEYQFLQRDVKISKLTSKIWKSKDSSLEEPLQTFYLRVQYYVENISLLKEKATRLQYYLQMKDNLLHYGQLVAEEKCFLLASYALQADRGDFVTNIHGNGYFDPREYFPASVVMRRGQDYITTHLPVMHRSMAGMLPTEARVNYIVELSMTPIAHNFHFYKMRRRKYDTAAVAWLAICSTGLGVYEEVDGFRYPVTLFRWPDIGKLHFEKKKFEIISEGMAGPKYTFYFDCKEWAEYIVDFCRQVHRFHLKLQPQIAELQQCHAQDLRFREKYVYSENSECTLDRHQFLTRISPGDQEDPNCHESAASALSRNTSLASVGQEEQEIFITTPPRLVSNSSLLLELPHQLQSFDEHDRRNRQLQETREISQRQLAYVADDNGNSRGEVEVSLDNIPASFASYSVPASSSDSLTFLPFMKTDSFQRDHPQLLASSATSSITHSQAPSNLTTPSQRSASPSSSAGSGQLPLSLPISRDVYDAALLRQSLPHGVHFNDYLQNLWSGREVASNSTSAERKNSFDHLQLNLNRFIEPVQRSTSLRQPLVDWGENRKGSKPSSRGDGVKTQSGLSVMRSNSDKTQQSSKLALLPEFSGPRAVAQLDVREVQTPSAAFALPSGTVTVAHNDGNRGQNLSLFSASSGQIVSIPGNSMAAVSRSDSNKSQKSILAPSYQAAMIRSDDGIRQKLGLTYQHEEGCSIVQKREDGQLASGVPYPIIPVEAQIQKLVFGPTMTAVSTPVRPAAEKPVGSLPTISYQSPYTYIPDSFPASVIRPSLRSGGYVFSVPHQDVAAITIPSDVIYQSNGSTYPSQFENRPSLPQLSSDYLASQAVAAQQISSFEPADGEYRERPSPPPYGAYHSTISSVQFQNPIPLQAQQMQLAQLHRMTPTQPSQVTVAKPFPTDASARQPQQIPATGLDLATSSGKRELSMWLMVNDNKFGGQQKLTGSMQLQGHGSLYNINQDTRGGACEDRSSTRNHRMNNSVEVPLEQINRDKKNEVTRHVSDRHPGYHDLQCPRHGISSDIRERLRGLGSSVPPMLNALLTDKSLHNTGCTCLDNHGDKRVAAAHSSDSLNLSGLSVLQTKGRNGGQHKLRYFPDLSLEGDATMIINGTMTSNRTYELEETDEDSGQHELSSAVQKARSETGRWSTHHLSDSAERPQRTGQLSHNQSNSDSAMQKFVFSEC